MEGGEQQHKLGAPPALRCTSSLVGLAVGLGGLVLSGIGACLAGFLGHESLTVGCGIALVVLGCVMIIVGFGLFFVDYYCRRPQRAALTPAQDAQASAASLHGSLNDTSFTEASVAMDPALNVSHHSALSAASASSRPTASSVAASSSHAPSPGPRLVSQPPSRPASRLSAAEPPPPYQAVVSATTTSRTTTTRLPLDAPIRPPKASATSAPAAHKASTSTAV